MSEEQTTPAQAEEAPAAPKPEGPAREFKPRAGTAPNDDRGASPFGKEGRPRPKRRRKVSFLTLNKIEKVDYKDVGLLKRFINEQGKILGARQTGNTAKQQRMISRAIRRAREMALMPFVSLEIAQPERGYRGEGRPPRRFDREPREPREPKVAPAPTAAPQGDASAESAAE